MKVLTFITLQSHYLWGWGATLLFLHVVEIVLTKYTYDPLHFPATLKDKLEPND